MQRKFKLLLFILFLLFICLFVYSKENKRYVTFIPNYGKDLSEDIIVTTGHLIDIAEMELQNNFIDVFLKKINGEIDPSNLESISDYSRSVGINAFYFIDVKSSDNSTDIQLNLYNLDVEKIYEKSFKLEAGIEETGSIISDALKDSWLEAIRESHDILITSKEKIFSKKRIKSKISLEHDFPIFNISLTALSGKIYFDERTTTYPQKMFSFFPIQARASFFPLKYFEAGVFFKLIYDNMIYKYDNLDNKKTDFFDSGLVFYYGIFAGLSFFNEVTHYSIGIEMYNLYYDLSKNKEWNKTDDFRSYFLPQISLYQKIDFRLFKFLYYSVQLNLRTIPQFQLSDVYMRSYPFLFDFFIVEISVVGLSIMF